MKNLKSDCDIRWGYDFTLLDSEKFKKEINQDYEQCNLKYNEYINKEKIEKITTSAAIGIFKKNAEEKINLEKENLANDKKENLATDEKENLEIDLNPLYKDLLIFHDNAEKENLEIDLVNVCPKALDH